MLFNHPGKHDPLELVPTVARDGAVPLKEAPPAAWRRRAGFSLTDAGADRAVAADQANYCITCVITSYSIHYTKLYDAPCR